MRTRFATFLGTLAVSVTTLALAPAVATADPAGDVNNPSCRSETHPDPVVILHGLTANKDIHLDALAHWLAGQGHCTFSVTYGTYPAFPTIGGIRPVDESAAEIKGFIQQVLDWTGAEKVALVGHSEGGFHSLYVPKTQSIAEEIRTVVAIAPPTNSSTFSGILTTAYRLVGQEAVGAAFRSVGCAACDELTTGDAVAALNDGPIAQPGVRYTIITSRYDQAVTPTESAFVFEPGVSNIYVQDFCPQDTSGHLGEAFDPNIWQLVDNALDPPHAEAFSCQPVLPL